MPKFHPSRTRKPRVIGFDDTPFDKSSNAPVAIAGVVCAGTRFEGLLWGQVTRDGHDATAEVVRLLGASKFLPQLHGVLFDGLAFAGFNLVDLPAIHAVTGLPAIAVMRRAPDLARIERALDHLSQPELRRELIRRAGTIYQRPPFWFQCAGIEPDAVVPLLTRCTDTGHVPEALRLAHLIGGAVITGESGRRA